MPAAGASESRPPGVEVGGRERAVGAPALAELPHVALARQLLEPVGRSTTLRRRRSPAGRTSWRPSAPSRKRSAVQGPMPAHGDQLGHHLLVGQLVEAVELEAPVERPLGQVAQRGELAAREPDRAQLARRWRRRPPPRGPRGPSGRAGGRRSPSPPRAEICWPTITPGQQAEAVAGRPAGPPRVHRQRRHLVDHTPEDRVGATQRLLRAHAESTVARAVTEGAKK